MNEAPRWQALAAALVDGSSSAATAGLSSAEVSQLAWALKAEAYAAWSVAPARASRCAEVLEGLHAQAPGPEVAALADWTIGVAALAEGRTGDALLALQNARARLQHLGLEQAAAETAVPQIVALSLLGRHEEALQIGRAALAGFDATGDARSAGKVELNLATLLTRLDRPAEAAPLYRRAAVRFARLGDVEHSVMADIGLANALTMQLELDEALRINERARMRAVQHRLPVLHAHAQGAIGRIELHRGHHALALAALADAVRLLEQAQAAPQRLLEAETALANAYVAVRLLDEGERLFQRVEQAAAALRAPTEQAWALLNRAQVLAMQGRAVEAAAALARARALFKATGTRVGVGLADLGQGALLLEVGDLAGARRCAAQAEEVLRDTAVAAWLLQAQVQQAEAETALQLAGPARAAESEAAQLRVQRLQQLTQACADLTPLRERCLACLGALALSAGDRVEARRCYEASLATLDRERAALPDDMFRAAVSARGQAAHQGLVELALAQGDAVALLQAIERGRNRAWGLVDPTLVGGATAAAACGADASADANGSAMALRSATERLRWCHERWLEAARVGADAERLLAAQTQVREAEGALLELRRRLALRSVVGGTASGMVGDATPAADVAPAEPAWPAVPALQAALGPQRALVLFHIQRGRLSTVLVTDELITHLVAPVGDLVARIQGLRFQLDSHRFGAARAQGHAELLHLRAKVHAQTLYGRLWAPLLPLLGRRRRVVVVPHGVLNELPLAALHDGQQWLVQNHQLLLAPSAAAWLAGEQRLRGQRPRARQVVALAGPGPGLPHLPLEVASVCQAHAVPGAALGDPAPPPVPQALLGDAASRAALREAAGHATLLHLACHGQFRADNPAFSSLQLADGPVALHELAQWRLHADLVVLSACETGQSRAAAGDEVLGLVRAVHRAGAAAVLASLWAVHDGATASLMARLHQGLASGLDAAEALRQAQAEAAAADQHPFYWGAFVLHGNV